MTVQVAIACVLLVGAGLLTRNLLALVQLDRGYDPNNLLTARLPLPAAMTFTQATGMLETMRERLRGLPGVTHAAFGTGLPLVTTGGLSGFSMPSLKDPGARVQIQSIHRTVSSDYFTAMRLRLVAGRFLSDTDTSTSQPVLVVNRSFASQYLGDDPIGRRLPFWMYGRKDWEVVGVVDDMKQEGLDVAGFTSTPSARQPEMFSSYRQVGDMFAAAVIFVVRTDTDPALAALPLRNIIREQAPTLALDSVMTMEDRLMSSLAQPRTYAFVLGGFAAFALAIALVGLMGVLSYSVAQRTREIGVRTALGARRADVVALVLRQGVGITAAGLALGMTAAALVAKALASILHGIQPYDPLTFAAVPITLAAFAALACAGPALRATRIDPSRALRSE